MKIKVQSLERLLEHYEQAVRTLRAAIALLAHGAPDGRLNNGRPGVYVASPSLKQAAAGLDAERRARLAGTAYVVTTESNGGGPPESKQKRGGKGSPAERIRKQRAASARYLAQYDRNDPRRPSDVRIKIRGVGAFVRRGYMAQKGGGYIRTAKPYHVDPAKAGE